MEQRSGRKEEKITQNGAVQSRVDLVASVRDFSCTSRQGSVPQYSCASLQQHTVPHRPRTMVTIYILFPCCGAKKRDEVATGPSNIDVSTDTKATFNSQAVKIDPFYETTGALLEYCTIFLL